MAAAVKLLFFHQLTSAATVVMPAVTSCSTVWLSMGSMGLPIPAAITKAVDILKQRSETEQKG